MIRLLLQLGLMILPWPLRRRALKAMFGYSIAPTARIGFSVVAPETLIMGEHAQIGHLSFITKLRLLEMGEFCVLGSLNRVTAMPRTNTDFFALDPDRDPCLVMEPHSAITNAHQIDCTDRVTIGAFATFAGWHSQILSHAIEFETPRQRARPVTIGSYSFVGTRSVLLPGAVLPDHCILAAGSVLQRAMDENYTLYGGVPAKAVKSLDADMGYFTRTTGFVH